MIREVSGIITTLAAKVEWSYQVVRGVRGDAQSVGLAVVYRLHAPVWIYNRFICKDVASGKCRRNALATFEMKKSQLRGQGVEGADCSCLHMMRV